MIEISYKTTLADLKNEAIATLGEETAIALARKYGQQRFKSTWIAVLKSTQSPEERRVIHRLDKDHHLEVWGDEENGYQCYIHRPKRGYVVVNPRLGRPSRFKSPILKSVVELKRWACEILDL